CSRASIAGSSCSQWRFRGSMAVTNDFMTGTLEQKTVIRSQQAEAMLKFREAQEQALSRNPFLERFGHKLDNLRIPLRFVPYEPIRNIEELRAREHFRQTGSTQEEGLSHAERVPSILDGLVSVLWRWF